MWNALGGGFGLAASLVIAIGAQNAMLLRMGLRRQHVVAGVVICLSADILLIAAGVAGLGTLLVAHPAWRTALRWAGVLYLGWFAIGALRQAHRGGKFLTEQSDTLSRRQSLFGIAGTTWLNPHVYIDTVLVLGTVSSTYGQQRWWFGVGAMCCSTLWFVLLGFGARVLTPAFRRPWTWRLLDGVVGLTVALVTVSLALRG
jgi:L-lysine exporter family protein LysE/ArgO